MNVSIRVERMRWNFISCYKCYLRKVSTSFEYRKKKKKKWGESLKSSKTLKRITVGYSGDAYSFYCRMHAIVIMG